MTIHFHLLIDPNKPICGAKGECSALPSRVDCKDCQESPAFKRLRIMGEMTENPEKLLVDIKVLKDLSKEVENE
jgi:hypothetical protein